MILSELEVLNLIKHEVYLLKKSKKYYMRKPKSLRVGKKLN